MDVARVAVDQVGVALPGARQVPQLQKAQSTGGVVNRLGGGRLRERGDEERDYVAGVNAVARDLEAGGDGRHNGIMGTPPLVKETGNTIENGSSTAGANKKKRSGVVERELPKLEKWCFLIMWGFDLIQLNFERYVMYVLLSYGISGCSFVDTYTQWMFVGTVLAIPTSFVSGYISDTIPTKQHIVMKVTSLCQLICQTFSIWLIFMHTSWASVLAGWFYQMRQAMFSQSMASIWKLLKMRLNFIEMSSDEKNALSNSISNSGDLFTELFEFAFILPMFLFPMSVSTVLFLACSASMIANIILVIIVFFYIRVFYYGLISKQTDNEEQDNQKTTSCGLSFCYEQVRKVRTIVVDCAHYITTTGVVLHTLVHTLGFMMLYVLICYPFALEAVQKSSGGKMNSLLNQTATIPAAKSDAIVTVEAVLIPTRENFCGGLVLDLMKQGFVLNIVFFVASIVYSQTLSDIAPRVFFKRINPVLLAITAGCLISVSLLNRVVGSTPALVVMSTAQVIPWYLSSYSYVTFNTAVSSENYGVTTMVYSLGQQLIYVVGTYLMSLYVPLWVLLVMCLGIVAVLVVHSLYIAPLFFSSDWGSSSASSEKL